MFYAHAREDAAADDQHWRGVVREEDWQEVGTSSFNIRDDNWMEQRVWPQDASLLSEAAGS